MLKPGIEAIPGHRLVKYLDRGQFGEVWHATTTGGTQAALKFIDIRGRSGFKQFRGVQLVKDIRHPHLMPITSIWLLDDELNPLGEEAFHQYSPGASNHTLAPDEIVESNEPRWLVIGMLLGDKNLQDRLKECQAEGLKGIPPAELLRYIEEAAKGLDFLNSPHEIDGQQVRVQHCDVKPANVMIMGDSAVVCDFGLAFLLGESEVTATSASGSPAYMSPEAIEKKPSRRTDQYSLAVTYYELRTGSLPFDRRSSLLDVFRIHSEGRLQFEDVEADERKVLRRATAKRPEERYASTIEMVEALRKAINPELLAEPSKTPLYAAFAGVGVCLLLLAALQWYVWPSPWRKQEEVTPVVEKQLMISIDVGEKFDPEKHRALQIQVDDEPAEISPEGKIIIPYASESRVVTITTQETEDYAAVTEALRVDEWQKRLERIRIPYSSQYDMKLGLAAAVAGDKQGAADHFAAALRKQQNALLNQPPPTQRLSQHTKSISLLRNTPSGLLSADDARTLKLWQWSNSGLDAEPKTLADSMKSFVRHSAAAKEWLATGGRSGELVIWSDFANEPQADAINDVVGDIVALASAEQGDHLCAFTSDKTGRVWRIERGKASPLATKFTDVQSNAAICSYYHNDAYLVAAFVNGQISRWKVDASGDPAQQTEMALPFSNLSHQLSSVIAIDENRTLLARQVDADEDRIEVFSLSVEASPTTEPKWSLPVQGPITALVFPSDSAGLFASEYSSKDVLFWEFNGKSEPTRVRLSHDTNDGVKSLAVNDKWLIVGREGGTVVLRSRTNLQDSISLTFPPDSGTRAEKIALRENGNHFVVATNTGHLLVWDLRQCEAVFDMKKK